MIKNKFFKITDIKNGDTAIMKLDRSDDNTFSLIQNKIKEKWVMLEISELEYFELKKIQDANNH